MRIAFSLFVTLSTGAMLAGCETVGMTHDELMAYKCERQFPNEVRQHDQWLERSGAWSVEEQVRRADRMRATMDPRHNTEFTGFSEDDEYYAAFQAGRRYETGDGVEEDWGLALSYYTIATRHTYTVSIYNQIYGAGYGYASSKDCQSPLSLAANAAYDVLIRRGPRDLEEGAVR